ncbi:hypothetical protein SNEBB_006794 [Seison nebaliae]|nr:hypothetical protein SNEBB_006794 [Seison nebaliae]
MEITNIFSKNYVGNRIDELLGTSPSDEIRFTFKNLSPSDIHCHEGNIQRDHVKMMDITCGSLLLFNISKKIFLLFRVSVDNPFAKNIEPSIGIIIPNYFREIKLIFNKKFWCVKDCDNILIEVVPIKQKLICTNLLYATNCWDKIDRKGKDKIYSKKLKTVLVKPLIESLFSKSMCNSTLNDVTEEFIDSFQESKKEVKEVTIRSVGSVTKQLLHSITLHQFNSDKKMEHTSYIDNLSYTFTNIFPTTNNLLEKVKMHIKYYFMGLVAYTVIQILQILNE